MTEPSRADADRSLIADLRREIGAEHVVTAPAELEMYSHDAWPVSVVTGKLGRHPYLPSVAAIALTEHDVLAILRVAREHQVPVTTRALGSSVTGQPLPVKGGVILDVSRLVQEPELDEQNHVVTVAAGLRGGDLEEWLNVRGYTLNHFPQSLLRSSVGGWAATLATGQLSSRYGGIENLVTGYRVLLVDGTAVDLGSKPRAAVGPNLMGLFLGSEGAFGVIVKVSMKVFTSPAHERSQAYALPSVETGIAVMREITHTGLRPSLVRFYDQAEAQHAAPSIPVGSCLLFLTHRGPPSVASAEAGISEDIALQHGGLALGPGPVDEWYKRRFDFSAVESALGRPGGFAETIEVAHLWSHIGALHQALRDALAPFADEVLGHISHVYDQGASLYIILLGQAQNDLEALSRLGDIWETAMKTTLEQGGEISHHHGAGLARQAFIPESLGSQHTLLMRLKNALDPEGILNPGKLGLD